MIGSIRPLAVVALLAVVVVAACGDDDPAEPAANEHTFEYVPSAGTPAITSIVVRGTFNDWAGNAMAMTEQSDGTWEVTREFEPGTYFYKYVFNGEEWASDMCNDATWGNPANDNRVDPNVTVCVNDDHGGQNAQLVID